jgi:hypothetical protein
MPQPPKKLTPKIILEGTRLTHKTDIAFALNEHPRIVGPRRYRYHSPLISAEWCAFTNWPWGRGPINFAPEEESRAMETYATWARLFELMPYYSWIVDRFHISTQVWQASAGRRYDFRWLEERLLPLRFAIVSCQRSPESFAAAREERLKVSGNPGQYDDLEAFIREQEAFGEALQNSILPRMTVDVSDGNIARICDQIASFFDAHGLLGMP